MRNLTLNEKITIRGILARKNRGLELGPRFSMKDAVWFFPMAYGVSVGKYGKYV